MTEVATLDVKVTHIDDAAIPRTDLPGGSWSKGLVTRDTVGAGKVMLGISTFRAGTSTPQKIHEEEELCFVIRGWGEITVGEDAAEFKPGSGIYIPAGVPHGVRNGGPEDVVMVYVFSCQTYPPTRDADQRRGEAEHA